MGQFDAAKELLDLGWNVVAAPRGGKSPLGAWGQYQTERVTERLLHQVFDDKPHNLFVITGSISRLLVLDCDNDAAVRWWREQLGDVLEETTRVRTGNGYHFYFRLPEGVKVRNRSSTDPRIKWDIRAEGGGVIAPPSIHESGRQYRWTQDRGPDAIRDCPDELAAVAPEGEPQEEPRSMLSQLLANPAAEGGRNNWLARVAGHYAKLIPHLDAYDLLVREANAKLQPPLPEHEVAKTIASIWSSEQAKEGKAAPDQEDDSEAWRDNLLRPSEDTGWLVSGKICIMVQVRVKEGDHTELALARWLNADLHVLGVIEGDEDRTYEVEVLKPDGETITSALPASTVADSRKLNAWLADRGVSIGAPDNMSPTRMKEGARLSRYLEAQDAEVLEAVDALGWHEPSEAFVCHEGIIRADGPAAHERVRPDPALKEWAPYRYGHAGRDTAADILAEVLQFHHEEVAAVFGSWWAATLLKPQVMTKSSQFPFMALEAASESGKTTGFFSLMLQLSGNAAGNSNPTRAALRDYLSGHHSGIVWMDDLDSLEQHGELLRNVTVGGAMVKKGDGNHKQVVAQLRAALVVSGESLGLMGQKALLDRAVLLEVPSPTGRVSVKDPSRPQWDDVLDLRARHPNLTDFSGSIVELALAQADMADDFKKFRLGSGRYADKLAVLRFGARVLQEILGEGRGAWVVDLTDRWVAESEDTGSENALTLKLLPLCLARTGWKQRPEGPDPSSRTVGTPAFVHEDGCVWFSPQLLADWWEREPPVGKRLDPRVESCDALTQQARQLGMGGSRGTGARKSFRLVTGEGTRVYWRVPEELTRTLLERSRGDDTEGDDDGEDTNGKLL